MIATSVAAEVRGKQGGWGSLDSSFLLFVIRDSTEHRTTDMMVPDLLVAKRAWIVDADIPAERRRRNRSDFFEYKDEHRRFADFQP